MAYLNKKYQVKSNMFNRTEPEFYQRNEEPKKSNKINTMEYSNNKFQIKERPSTSKGSKREDSVKSAQIYEK